MHDDKHCLGVYSLPAPPVLTTGLPSHYHYHLLTTSYSYSKLTIIVVLCPEIIPLATQYIDILNCPYRTCGSEALSSSITRCAIDYPLSTLRIKLTVLLTRPYFTLIFNQLQDTQDEDINHRRDPPLLCRSCAGAGNRSTRRR